MALKVFCEASCSTELQKIISEGQDAYFDRTSRPGDADVVIFQRDDWRYVRSSEIFKAHYDRCIAVTEWDHPSFFLPTICSSNTSSWLAKDRTETMEYPFRRRSRWNPYLPNEPASVEKRLLYSLVGKSSSRVRKHLFRQFRHRVPDDVIVANSGSAVQGHTTYSAEFQEHYVQTLLSSKFALCPRGWGTGSVRLFEACELGVAPVILSDNWPPVCGMDWSFAIFIPERNAREVDKIIRAAESEWRDRGRAARKAFETQFSPVVSAEKLCERILRLRQRITLSGERSRRSAFPVFYLKALIKDRLRKAFVSYRP